MESKVLEPQLSGFKIRWSSVVLHRADQRTASKYGEEVRLSQH